MKTLAVSGLNFAADGTVKQEKNEQPKVKNSLLQKADSFVSKVKANATPEFFKEEEFGLARALISGIVGVLISAGSFKKGHFIKGLIKAAAGMAVVSLGYSAARLSGISLLDKVKAFKNKKEEKPAEPQFQTIQTSVSAIKPEEKPTVQTLAPSEPKKEEAPQMPTFQFQKPVNLLESKN